MDRDATRPGIDVRRRYTATPHAMRVNVDGRDVSDRFEVFVAERALGWLPRIRSESDLPYPKEIIQARYARHSRRRATNRADRGG